MEVYTWKQTPPHSQAASFRSPVVTQDARSHVLQWGISSKSKSDLDEALTGRKRKQTDTEEVVSEKVLRFVSPICLRRSKLKFFAVTLF